MVDEESVEEELNHVCESLREDIIDDDEDDKANLSSNVINRGITINKLSEIDEKSSIASSSLGRPSGISFAASLQSPELRAPPIHVTIPDDKSPEE